MRKIAMILVVLAALAVAYLHSNLNTLVKAAIEKYGTAAAQAEVRVDSVQLSISSGEGSITGLTVDNPKGFSSGRAVGFGLVSVQLDPGSITGSGPVIIREVIIDKPQVHVEAMPTGETNLQALEKNLTASSHAGAASSAAGDGTSGGKHGRKIIISDLTIRDGEVNVSSPLLKKALTAPLPPIHLTDIGKDSGGATPAQVAHQVLASIAADASKVAADNLGKNLGGNFKGAVSGNAGAIGDRVKGLLGR